MDSFSFDLSFFTFRRSSGVGSTALFSDPVEDVDELGELSHIDPHSHLGGVLVLYHFFHPALGC